MYISHPIDKLPPELLSKIFLETLPPVREVAHLSDPLPEVMMPTILSAISQSWRQLSITTRELWGAIFVVFGNDLRKHSMSLESVLLWLQRSRGRPSTLVLLNTLHEVPLPFRRLKDTDFWELDFPILKAVFPFFSQLKNLCLYISPQTFTIPRLGFTDPPIPLLAQLPSLLNLQYADINIILTDPSVTEVAHSFLDNVIVPLLEAFCRTNVVDAPLQDLRIKVEGIDSHRLSFGLPTQASPSLTSLELSHPDMGTLLALLSSTPNLRDLTIYSEELRPDTSFLPQSLIPTSPILLPSLHSLCLVARSCPDLFTFLDYIQAPACEGFSFTFTEPEQDPFPRRPEIINFLSRSRCPVERLVLGIAMNCPETPLADIIACYPFPLEGDLVRWESVKTLCACARPNDVVLLLCGLCKNLTTLSLEVDECGSLMGDSLLAPACVLSNLTVLYLSSSGGEGQTDKSFLTRITAPALQDLSIEAPVPSLITSLSQFLNASHCSLSYLALLSLESLGSQHIIDILSNPTAHSLPVLFLECVGLEMEDDDWFDDVLDYLSRRDDGSVALPFLQELFVSGPFEHKPGHLGELLKFRFTEAGLKIAGGPISYWRWEADYEEDVRIVDELLSCGHKIESYRAISGGLSERSWFSNP